MGERDERNALDELASYLGRLALKGACVQIVAARFEWLTLCGEEEEEDVCVLHHRPNESRAAFSLDLAEMETFLKRSYDPGFGSQKLDGTVWLSDGTWLTRGEYDGSEWWERHSCPAMPDD